MKPGLVLLLLALALSTTLAANVHGDQGHAEGHRVVRRGILEKISSAARSLRDEASSFFERSWVGLKSAITDFMNWMRGISPPKDVRASQPPPVRPPADLPEESHPYYPGAEPTNVGGSNDPPTVHPSRYSPSATPSENAGDKASHSTPETTRQQVTTSQTPQGSTTTDSPNTEGTSSATRAPTLATSAAPSEASTEPSVEATSESVLSTSGEVIVTAGATSTSTETVSKTPAAGDRGSRVNPSTPAILATRDPKLPDDVDESENDVDLPPPKPTAQPKRRNGGGFVIADAR